MKKVKCVNGHFFDLDRFSVCPRCGSGVGAEPVKGGPMSRNPISKHPVSNHPISRNPSGKGEAVTELLPDSKQPASTPGTGKAGGIVWNFKPKDKEKEKQPQSQNVTGAQSTSKPEFQTIPDAPEELPPSLIPKEDPAAPVKPVTNDSETTLIQAVANTGHGVVSALPKTVAYYDQFTETVPPTGWLVCVRGPHKGEAFPCKVNKNRIGRNAAFDIPLVKDQSVNREIYATLIFDPKNRKFYLHDGSGDGLVYVNDELLFSHTELKAYDRIQLGKSECVFIPLCGERFSWDDYND